MHVETAVKTRCASVVFKQRSVMRYFRRNHQIFSAGRIKKKERIKSDRVRAVCSKKSDKN